MLSLLRVARALWPQGVGSSLSLQQAPPPAISSCCSMRPFLPPLSHSPPSDLTFGDCEPPEPSKIATFYQEPMSNADGGSPGPSLAAAAGLCWVLSAAGLCRLCPTPVQSYHIFTGAGVRGCAPLMVQVRGPLAQKEGGGHSSGMAQVIPQLWLGWKVKKGDPRLSQITELPRERPEDQMSIPSTSRCIPGCIPGIGNLR